MNNRKIALECFRNLAYLTQFGVSLAMPPLLCLWAAGWLREKFQLGNWIMLVGLLLGLGGAVSSFVGFMRHVQRQADKEDKK